MDADIEEIREKYLNLNFDEKQFTIDPETTIQYAKLCGETADRFLDADHEEFQAPPAFIACLSGSRMLPKGFPRFGIGMDAGKGVECLQPVRPGSTVTGKTHLHDIYTKTGWRPTSMQSPTTKRTLRTRCFEDTLILWSS